MTGDEARQTAVLLCAVCLYVREEAENAVTVMDGTALCYDHLGYARDRNVESAKEATS